MLLQMAVGDAYGLGFEFGPPELFQHNDLSAYRKHPLFDTTPGNYSDDTERSLANAYIIVNRPIDDITKYTFAYFYVKYYKRKKRPGYSKHFTEVFNSIADDDLDYAGSFINKVISKDRTGCGSMMGACPIGLIGNRAKTLEIAALQAKTTHDSMVGILSAQCTALAVRSAALGLQRISLRYQIIDFINLETDAIDYIEYFTSPHTGPVGSLHGNLNGLTVLNAALTAIESSNSLSEILKTVVGYMGDVDSAAAVAMGIASCCKDVQHDLPAHLINNVEDYELLKTMDLELQRKIDSLRVDITIVKAEIAKVEPNQ